MSFLLNIWYVAAHAHELDDGIVARKICDQDLVLFRTDAGQPAALVDRCPHRFVPLSLGNVVGDTLQCAYHGLRFDGSGACVEAPNDTDERRAQICVRSFPMVERHGYAWIWMGDAEKADPSLIPVFEFMDDPKMAVSTGYNYMKGNYQLISDNLLDLSHVHYLHPEVHPGADFSNFTNKVKIEGDTVWSMLWRHQYPIDEGRKALWGFKSLDVEGQGHARWNAPSVLLISTAFWDHGTSFEEGAQTPNAHMLTPETAYSTHYFWSTGRNFHIEDENITKATSENVGRIFGTQDGPMIEAQQRVMGESDKFVEMAPEILSADAAGLAARRILKRMIDAEARERETP